MKTLLPLLILLISFNFTKAQTTAIPDANFEQALINLGLDSGPIDGLVNTINIDTVTNLDVSFSNIIDLTGINDFSNLTLLNCTTNLLTSLDLSQNTILFNLNCMDNQLNCLNVKNGNNVFMMLFGSFNATGNPNLTCIEVDDSSSTFTMIDTGVTFSTNCNNTCSTIIPCTLEANFSYLDNGNNNISFTDSSILSGTSPFSHFWNFTLDTTSVQNPNYTYGFNGDWYATLKVTDATGCSDSLAQLISVNSLPCNTTFTYIDNGNGNFSFTSSPTGVSPIGYSWNFDDGTIVQLPNPNHTFTSNGTYAVGLITQDVNVCETLDFDTIVITNIGCNSFSPNFNFINNGNGNYSFTNTSTGSFTSSHWSFGDGNTSLTTNSNHTFIADGTYVVVLAITDSLIQNGACVDYHTVIINVTGVPNPPSCNSGFVIFSDTISNNFIVVNSSIGNNLTFLWDFGDGNTSTQAYPNYTYTASGPFYLCLTVDNGNGCIDTYCDSIGSNGVVFKQAGFTINVISPPIITSIENTIFSSNIIIYPNPTTGTINIDLGKTQTNLTVTLTNNLGQIIFTQQYKSTDFINLDIDTPNGIYFLQIQTESGEIITKKIVKK